LLVTDDEVQCLNKSVRECAYIQLGMNGINKSCVCMDNSDKTRHLRCSSYDGHELWGEREKSVKADSAYHLIFVLKR
jgi:hypothetical protein